MSDLLEPAFVDAEIETSLHVDFYCYRSTHSAFSNAVGILRMANRLTERQLYAVSIAWMALLSSPAPGWNSTSMAQLNKPSRPISSWSVVIRSKSIVLRPSRRICAKCFAKNSDGWHLHWKLCIGIGRLVGWLPLHYSLGKPRQSERRVSKARNFLQYFCY